MQSEIYNKQQKWSFNNVFLFFYFYKKYTSKDGQILRDTGYQKSQLQGL